MAEIRNIISADTTRFSKGLDQAKAEAKSFGDEVFAGTITAVTGFVALEKVVGQAMEAFHKFGEIGDLSERFNVSGEAIQKFGHVFEQTGSSMETFVRGFGKLRLAMA